MATAIVHAFKPTRSRVLTLVVILAILFGCYGLLSAQQARSATLAKKAFAGVEVAGGTATLVHPVHVTAVIRIGTGTYKVTFDRHVDNCSFSTTADFRGGSGAKAVFELANGQLLGFSTSDEGVSEQNPASSSLTDTDFDIIALCPGT
jgi:hypothetical protein